MAKTPEQRLAEVMAEETESLQRFSPCLRAPGRGGQSYNMLSEAIRRHSRGEDVVIGIVRAHGRKGVSELAN